MLAFQEAVDSGCDVIETDLHISADNYIVIAHDVDTLRVFGEDYNIPKTNYIDGLDKLLTLREPRSTMPLFEDVLTWCVNINEKFKDLNVNRKIKLMLDIKTDNDPIQLYDLMWKLFEKVNGIDYWNDKLLFGLWRSDFYIPERFTDFPVIHITFDVNAAIKFYNQMKEVDGNAKLHAVSIINLVLYRKNDSLELIKWLNEKNIKLWFWTINDNLELQQAFKLARLSNGETLLEGVITDDPVKVLDESKSKEITTWKYNLRWWIKTNIYSLFLFLFRRGYNLRPFFVLMKKIGFI